MIQKSHKELTIIIRRETTWDVAGVICQSVKKESRKNEIVNKNKWKLIFCSDVSDEMSKLNHSFIILR